MLLLVLLLDLVLVLLEVVIVASSVQFVERDVATALRTPRYRQSGMCGGAAGGPSQRRGNVVVVVVRGLEALERCDVTPAVSE